MKIGTWIDELVGSIEKNMNLETVAGVQRGGRISGFTYRSMTLNGNEVRVPVEIELNGDPNDRVPLDRIQKITIG